MQDTLVTFLPLLVMGVKVAKTNTSFLGDLVQLFT